VVQLIEAQMRIPGMLAVARRWYLLDDVETSIDQIS